MKEIKQERKHLIITDELELLLTVMGDDVDRVELINSLIKLINGEAIDLDDLYSTTRNILAYFNDGKRIKNLILEENKEAKS